MTPGRPATSFWTGMCVVTLRFFRHPTYHNLNPAVVRPVNTEGSLWQAARIRARLHEEF